MCRETGKVQDPLLEAKTTIPDRPKGAVIRENLILQLENGSEDAAVLKAGAGFGKTTLMAELARRHGGYCCWYQMDISDNNPGSFFFGIYSAISRVLMKNLPEINESGQKEKDIAETYRLFLSAFLLAIGEKPFYICIDDFQIISNEQIYLFIRDFIGYGKGKIRLFLATDGRFPPFLAAYILQGRIMVLDTEQLRFKKEETERLLESYTGDKPTEKQVKRIQEYTRGWPAGIVFAGLGSKRGQPECDGLLFFNPDYLYDYMFYEIFHKLSFETQTFLSETSVLEEMDPAVCNYALERSDSEYMLSGLADEKFFLSKINRNTYQYDAVFSDFLRNQVLPERKEVISCRAKEYQAKKKGFLLQVKCLGQFEVSGANGRLKWRTKKTKELFACLFFEEGRGIKKDILMDRLWPEMSAERASVLFHTTVSYLRRALAQAEASEALLVENQSYLLHMDRIESDIKLLMRWNHYAGEKQIPKGQNALEAAEVYHACYMYGEDYVWLGGHREYMEQIFLQTMEGLAKIKIDEHEFGQAALLLKKALEIDSYAVSLFGLLVECLLLEGKIQGAKNCFTKMEKICREELSEEINMDFNDYVKKAKNRRRQC